MGFGPLNVDVFVVEGVYGKTSVVGPDRKGASEAAIDHNQQFYLSGAAEMIQRRQGGQCSSTAVKNVVDENHAFVFDQEVNLRCLRSKRTFGRPEVIAVKGNVQFAVFEARNTHLGESESEPISQFYTAGLDSYKAGITEVSVFLDEVTA
jgi:hypothetical protein